MKHNKELEFKEKRKASVPQRTITKPPHWQTKKING